jgi:hypothetical protein
MTGLALAAPSSPLRASAHGVALRRPHTGESHTRSVDKEHRMTDVITRLMQANLIEVFNQRDTELRRAAINRT